MKVVLLFMVTIMLFFLYLVPLIWPFGSVKVDGPQVGAGYTFWYLMVFILTCFWGSIVKSNGCWFFDKRS